MLRSPDILPPQYKPTMPDRKGILGTRSRRDMYEAHLVVASYEDEIKILKNRYDNPENTKIIDVVIHLLSKYFFGKNQKMFAPFFEKDLRKAILHIIKKHNLQRRH